MNTGSIEIEEPAEPICENTYRCASRSMFGKTLLILQSHNPIVICEGTSMDGCLRAVYFFQRHASYAII